MRWVEVAAIRPHHCAFIPYIGGQHPQGFFDWGTELPGGDYAYCSVVAAEEMARFLGWSPPGDQEVLAGRVEELEREARELRDQVREADRFAEAAEYTLGRFGSKVQRKPGRPRKEVVADG